jgi:dTDP-4-dehydrorhamnose reductase
VSELANMRINERNGVSLNSKVIILGSSGMLGQEVVKVFAKEGISFLEFSRQPAGENFFDFQDQSADEVSEILSISQGDYVVNCIGWIPQRATGDLAVDKENAWKLNVRLPMVLEELAEKFSVRVLQVATDCVFDGSVGNYLESDTPSADDVYGKSKIAGEASQPSAMRIRCSIIGQDRNSNAGLFSWYVSQPKDGSVTGYANHFWNGVTTTALAKLFVGIIREDNFSAGLQHWIPRDSVSKWELLSGFRDLLGGNSATVLKGEGSSAVNRTLSTSNQLGSDEYWILAGYGEAPSISKLVKELVDSSLI